MRFGAVYCLYDDHEYLNESVEAVVSQLDKILFLMSDVPWHGRGCDNSATKEAVRALCRKYPHCECIAGHWEDEIEQRNFGLDRFLEWEIDIYFVIDSDEIYREDHFARIKQFITALPQAAAYHLEWNTYWKKDYFRIEPREEYKPLIAVRPNSFQFTIIRGGISAVQRTTSGVQQVGSGYNAVLIPPEVGICYHLSYARSDEYMMRKLETNSHAPDFIPNWFNTVWKGWTPASVNLHPIHPAQDHRAVRESLAEFPRSLKSFIKRERLSGRSALLLIIGGDTTEWSRVVSQLSSRASHGHEVAVLSDLPPRGCGNICWVESLRSVQSVLGAKDLCVIRATAVCHDQWLRSLYQQVQDDPDAGVALLTGGSPNAMEAALIIREVIDDTGFPRSLDDDIFFSEVRRRYRIIGDPAPISSSRV